jgi:hypothetical protein|nr:MAG TPA: hypothetical protein [Caudoviricetes sp.]
MSDNEVITDYVVTTEGTNITAPAVKPKNDLLDVGVFDLPDPVEVARRAEQTKKMLAAACSVLSYSDITLQGGKPYIDHYGCKKIANLFGLIVRQDEIGGRINYQKEIIDEATNHYIIHISGRVWHKSSPDNYEIYEGTADSFDDWFSQYQIKEEREIDGKTKKVVVSAQTLPVSKVQEKATANLLQRAIKKKLGLQFTREELEQYGFDMSKVKGFNFNGSSEPDSQEVADKKKNVWAKIVEICNGNIELAKKTLKKHTSFTKSDGSTFEGYDDINKVKEKPLEILIKKVDKAYAEHLKAMENGGAE